jgi:hypothetical protein
VGAHEPCATHNCKVSQLKITPRSDRKHNCADCASTGFCQKHSGGGSGGGGVVTKSTATLKAVAQKPLGGPGYQWTLKR